MKKNVLLFVLMLLATTLLHAQPAYYYYKGDKIPIIENLNKASVVKVKSSPNFSPVTLASASSGVKVSQVIEDDVYDIVVYEASLPIVRGAKTTSLHSSLKKELAQTSAMVLPCYQSADGSDLTLTNYLNIKLKSENDYSILKAIANDFHLEIISQNQFMPLWYVLSITKATGLTSLDAANAIYETGKFTASVADFVSNDKLISYDPNVTQQWGLYNSIYEGMDISISSAWNYSTGRGIKIGILDEGIELTHSDLAANIYPLSYDTESGTSPSRVFGPHGTHCAGIAAAVRNNGIYIAGVAPDAKLVSISNSLAGSTNSRMKRADGINWAWKHGVDIISNSWFSSTKYEVLDEAIDSALVRGREGKGCVIVFAAGNFNRPVEYPANCRDKILAVGALESTGMRASYSNYGEKLDIMAPGSDILSTVLNNSIDEMSGTSMACPHVAGVAALILARNPRLTVQQVNNIIEKTAKKISVNYNVNKSNGTWNYEYGYGLVDAYNAVINTPR